MKALFALLIVLIGALLFWALSDQAGDSPGNLNTSSKDRESTPSDPPESNPPSHFEPVEDVLPNTGRTRVIGQKKPQGLTATWHPEKEGVFISPYNQEEIKAIGVVSGSKTNDSDGNELIVPPFEKSPVKIYPIGSPVPDRPGYAFNPYTQNEVDVRGIPKGSLVQDPNDPEKKNHRFRTPGN